MYPFLLAFKIFFHPARIPFYVLFALVILFAAPTTAVPLVDEDDWMIDFTGYFKNISNASDYTFDSGLTEQDPTFMNMERLRLRLKLDWYDMMVFEIHDELSWNLSSTGYSGGGSALGVDVGSGSDQTVDLSTAILKPCESDKQVENCTNGLALNNDIDRLFLKLYLPWFDLIIGRQPISWGVGRLINPVDLFSVFSPFEMDREEKVGIDSIRAIIPIGDLSKLDLVVADKGSLENLSGGFRLEIHVDIPEKDDGSERSIESFELHVTGGKFWNEVGAGLGLETELAGAGFRAEVFSAYSYDEEKMQLPRAMVGFDYRFKNGIYLMVDYHFNGVGVSDSDDYVNLILPEEYSEFFPGSDVDHKDLFSRGEVFLLGRHYLMVAATYQLHPLLNANLMVMGNLTDPSMIVTPTLTYSFAQDVELSAGAYLGFGERPEKFDVTQLDNFKLNSEFGNYPFFYYLQFSCYW